MRTVALALCGALIATAAAGYILSRAPRTPPLSPAPAPRAPAPSSLPSPRPDPVSTTQTTPPPTPLPAALSAVTAPERAPEPAPESPTKPVKPKKPKRELKDPRSREALALVGSVSGAEIRWLAAINNEDLPAEERSDLIEDLNEEGFADPRQPTREDLPLIVNRLALIRRYAPFAIDQVNAEAFAEAHKDLMIMYNRLNP